MTYPEVCGHVFTISNSFIAYPTVQYAFPITYSSLLFRQIVMSVTKCFSSSTNHGNLFRHHEKAFRSCKRITLPAQNRYFSHFITPFLLHKNTLTSFLQEKMLNITFTYLNSSRENHADLIEILPHKNIFFFQENPLSFYTFELEIL